MITIDLKDPHLSENFKVIQELQRGALRGLLTDEEIQMFYNEQIKKDAKTSNAEHCICRGATIPEGRQGEGK